MTMIRDLRIGRNYTKGRDGVVPDMVVIHVTEGNAAAVRSWFASEEAKVSAHYMVCKDGTIDQFVAEEDTAWHAGRVYNPTADLVINRPGQNPNDYSIGVEHEGSGKEPMTPAQLAASLSLVAGICARWHIPMDRHRIVGHREIYALKTCPGAIDVGAYVRALTAAHPFGKAQRPGIVYSNYLRDYLIVTRAESDTDWSFVPMAQVRQLQETKGETPLSGMPTAAP